MKLYRTILGEQWNELDPLFRKYLDQNQLQATGDFEIQNGNRLISFFLARLFALPRPNPKAKVKLTVYPENGHEIWKRSFPDKNLTSIHSFASEKVLSEDFGTFRFLFKLTADNGGVLFEHQSTFVHLLGTRFRLPRFVSPYITAREDPTGTDQGSKVFVTLSIPLFGTILSYGGIIRKAPA